MRHHILCCFILLGLTLPLRAKDTDEVSQALAAVGTGSAAELKSRLFADQITVFNAEFRAKAITTLPTAVRNQRLTEGKLLLRVETAFQQVLQLHGRGGKVELFLFQDDVPSAMLWRGCILVLSTGLADPLYDAELAGVLAHELGHSYFEDEMANAQRQREAAAMRVVELKCDAVALLSLKLLAYDPAAYLKGLQRIQEIKRRKSLSSSIQQSHPEFVLRAQFSQRFIKLLG
ncbi:MAG: M48 family metalloprotease [Blastocatellia bacterium]